MEGKAREICYLCDVIVMILRMSFIQLKYPFFQETRKKFISRYYFVKPDTFKKWISSDFPLMQS